MLQVLSFFFYKSNYDLFSLCVLIKQYYSIEYSLFEPSYQVPKPTGDSNDTVIVFFICIFIIMFL